MFGKTNKFRRFTDSANHQDQEILEGLSCHFLYCTYMIPCLYEPCMNFRKDFLILSRRLNRFLDKILSSSNPDADLQKDKKINAHLIRRKMSINLLIELWKGFGVWQNPQISAFHRFYQTSRRRIYWRDLRVISFTVTIWYHPYVNPTWIFGQFPKIFLNVFSIFDPIFWWYRFLDKKLTLTSKSAWNEH